MKLSDDAIAQIKTEASKSMTAPDYIEPQDISADSTGKNKTIILGFLTTLVALLPGVIGKLAGQGIIVAAEGGSKIKAIKISRPHPLRP